jgi:hypothetical protein
MHPIWSLRYESFLRALTRPHVLADGVHSHRTVRAACGLFVGHGKVEGNHTLFDLTRIFLELVITRNAPGAGIFPFELLIARLHPDTLILPAEAAGEGASLHYKQDQHAGK